MFSTIRLGSTTALFASVLAVSGCSTAVDSVSGYLPVHDLPPKRGDAPIPPAEQAKIQAELLATRDRQATQAASK